MATTSTNSTGRPVSSGQTTAGSKDTKVVTKTYYKDTSGQTWSSKEAAQAHGGVAGTVTKAYDIPKSSPTYTGLGTQADVSVPTSQEYYTRQAGKELYKAMEKVGPGAVVAKVGGETLVLPKGTTQQDINYIAKQREIYGTEASSKAMGDVYQSLGKSAIRNQVTQDVQKSLAASAIRAEAAQRAQASQQLAKESFYESAGVPSKYDINTAVTRMFTKDKQADQEKIDTLILEKKPYLTQEQFEQQVLLKGSKADIGLQTVSTVVGTTKELGSELIGTKGLKEIYYVPKAFAEQVVMDIKAGKDEEKRKAGFKLVSERFKEKTGTSLSEGFFSLTKSPTDYYKQLKPGEKQALISASFTNLATLFPALASIAATGMGVGYLGSTYKSYKKGEISKTEALTKGIEIGALTFFSRPRIIDKPFQFAKLKVDTILDRAIPYKESGVRVVEGTTIPTPLKELMKFEGTKADTIHTTLAGKEFGYGSVLKPGEPGAVGPARASIGQFNFYQSLPAEKPVAYGGYVGLGEAYSGGTKTEFRLFEPTPKAIIFREQEISATPTSIIKKGIKETVRYQTETPGTYIPAENIFGRSIERQATTSVGYETPIYRITPRKEAPLYEKYTYYNYKKKLPEFLASNKKIKSIWDLFTSKNVKIKFLEGKLEKVSPLEALPKEKVIDTTKYASEYGKTKYVSLSSVTKRLSFISPIKSTSRISSPIKSKSIISSPIKSRVSSPIKSSPKVSSIVKSPSEIISPIKSSSAISSIMKSSMLKSSTIKSSPIKSISSSISSISEIKEPKEPIYPFVSPELQPSKTKRKLELRGRDWVVKNPIAELENKFFQKQIKVKL